MDVIDVALALVRRDDGRWFVARRPGNLHLPGCWEFPGGKIEPGETPADAALRELREEAQLEPLIEGALPPSVHDYPDRRVRLHPFVCRLVGEPARRTRGQWLTTAELVALPMPAANATVLRQLAELFNDEST